MGLDMYLNKEFYASKHTKPEVYKELKKNKGFEDCESITISGIIICWRKANMIHKWFVNNVQDGVDECNRFYVPHEKLKELLSLVTEAIEEKDTGALPTQEGFFFGSVEYGEDYWADLEFTKSNLIKIVNDPDFEKYEFYYRASW